MKILSNHSSFISPLSRTCTSLALCATYKIMSVAMRCFQRKDAQNTYHLISEFYWQKADAIYAYYLFGNQIVHPSVNIEKIKNLRKPLDQVRIAQFVESANRQKAASIHEITTSDFPKQKITDGVCTSLSLNFISKLLKAGANTPEALDAAICSIGSKFREGASVKTGIIHGIQDSLHYSNEWWKSRNLELDYFQTVATLRQVRLEPTSLHCRFNSWEGAENFLTGQLDALGDGIYLVSEKGGKMEHVTAYVKRQGQRYLFDPQLGTIRIPANKDAEYLIKSTQAPSCNEIEFFKCALLP